MNHFFFYRFFIFYVSIKNWKMCIKHQEQNRSNENNFIDVLCFDYQAIDSTPNGNILSIDNTFEVNPIGSAGKSALFSTIKQWIDEQWIGLSRINFYTPFKMCSCIFIGIYFNSSEMVRHNKMFDCVRQRKCQRKSVQIWANNQNVFVCNHSFRFNSFHFSLFFFFVEKSSISRNSKRSESKRIL